MPIYEYRRPDGSTFEIVQSFSDDPLRRDPETGVSVERVLHAPAVHFKGKGFYSTDYGTRKRERETAAAASANGSKDPSGSKDSAAAKDSAGGSAGKGASPDRDAKGKDAGKDGAKRKGAKPLAASS
jgi:putative FmdB family regulatory protein